MAQLTLQADQVVIAIDPHNKVSWTAAVVDAHLQPVRTLRVEVNRDGYRRLRRFCPPLAGGVWAIEGATDWVPR